MSDLVRTAWRGSALHVELNRPERRNAISRALMTELRAVLAGDGIEQALALVISGAGGTFSAGADLGELTGTPSDAAFDDDWAQLIAAVRDCQRPVVAAIEGPCRGAAVDLVLACDVRVAGQQATVGVPAVRLGLLYRPAALARMHRAVGTAAVRRLMLIGDAVGAETARDLGLVHEVVVAGGAVDHAAGLVGQLPPESVDALAATKRLLTELDEETADMSRWDRAYHDLLGSAGRRALLDAAPARHRRVTDVHKSEEQR